MTKRKAISKKLREEIYRKYGGHCAYCGKKIELREMQVDHIKAVWKAEIENEYMPLSDDQLDELNKFDNLMPACRMCNYYKSTYSMEQFRENLEDILAQVSRPFDFRIAERYSLVQRTPHKIKFFFEEAQRPISIEEEKNGKKQNQAN